MWESPSCNNCGSISHKIFLKDIAIWEYTGKFRIVECNKCHLKYLSPRPRQKYISRYYSSESYWGENILDCKDGKENIKDLRERLYGNVYKEILKRRSRGRIFDVGAGTGVFLTKFRDVGWVIDGIEYSRDAVNFAKSTHNIHLKHGEFNKLKISKNRFDVVAFNSSLEHLYDPKGALVKAHKMLKKEGLLVLTVPNVESIGQLILKKNWWPLHPPKHLYHFSTNTLSSVVMKAGFRINKISYWYFQHAYYGIYESIRFMFSPKFPKKPMTTASRRVPPGSALGGEPQVAVRRLAMRRHVASRRSRAIAFRNLKEPPNGSTELTAEVLRAGEGFMGGVSEKEVSSKNKQYFLVKSELGKIIASVAAFIMALVGAIIKKGETITIYAKKA